MNKATRSLADESAEALPYRDRARSVSERVRDLIARMTLEEKAAQMLCVGYQKADKLVDAAGCFDRVRAGSAFGEGHGLGQVGRPSDAGGGRTARQMAELTNDIQRFFVENSRLGIPVIFHEECLHGHAAPEGTSFPQPIALAAFWPQRDLRRAALKAITQRNYNKWQPNQPRRQSPKSPVENWSARGSA